MYSRASSAQYMFSHLVTEVNSSICPTCNMQTAQRNAKKTETESQTILYEGIGQIGITM